MHLASAGAQNGSCSPGHTASIARRNVVWIASSAAFTGIGWGLTILVLSLVELLGGVGPVIAALAGGALVTWISTTVLSLLLRPTTVPDA